MKRIMIIFSIVLITASCGKKNEEVRIGIIQPLSGPIASGGKRALDGIRLATEIYNKKNNSKQIRLIVEDSKAEPAEGVIIKDIFKKLVEINKSENLTILIVEQKVKEILNIADKVYSFKLGRVAFAGKSTELQNNSEKLKELFL